MSKERELNWVYANKEAVNPGLGTIGMLRDPEDVSTFVAAGDISKEIGDNISHSIIPVSFIGTLEPQDIGDPSPFDGTVPQDICRAHASKIAQAWRGHESASFIDKWILAEDTVKGPLSFTDMLATKIAFTDLGLDFNAATADQLFDVMAESNILPAMQVLFLNAQKSADMMLKSDGPSYGFSDSVEGFDASIGCCVSCLVEIESTPHPGVSEGVAFISFQDEFGHGAAKQFDLSQFANLEFKVNTETLSNYGKESFVDVCDEIACLAPEFGVDPSYETELDEPETEFCR